jgi:GTPase
VIDEVFGVPGVGTVVAGTVKKGVITPNMTLMLGGWVGGWLRKAGARVKPDGEGGGGIVVCYVL